MKTLIAFVDDPSLIMLTHETEIPFMNSVVAEPATVQPFRSRIVPAASSTDLNADISFFIGAISGGIPFLVCFLRSFVLCLSLVYLAFRNGI